MRSRILLVLLFVVVAAAMPGTARAAGGPAGPTAGGFIISCDYSHTLMDDPIVFPGQPGASHSHDFFGNESTDANSTYDSMTQSASNCGLVTDTAGYWVPTPSFAGVEIHPAGNRGDMRIYYRAAGATQMETIPAGLAMIAGDKNATSPPALTVLKWYCGAGTGGTTPFSSHPYDCTSYAQKFSFVDGVVAIVNLPRCWDGSGLQPSDVAFATDNADCPPGFPHLMPQISERVHFGIMDPCGGLTPCGPTDPDTNVQLTVASGPYYTLHADFWNTWHQDVLDALMTDCVNAHIACSFLGSHYKLNVTTAGTGTGQVTSDPAGVTCGSGATSCTGIFDTTTHVTLTAAPSDGSVFSGWSGDCSGTGTCTVPMEHMRNVNAVFDAANGQTYTMSVTPAGEGGGVVRSSPAGISCPPTCSASFQPGTTVTLTATPDSDSLFDGWADDCTGAGECRLMMNQARFVTASFIQRVYRPDAAIRTKGHRFVGDEVRGGTGVSQTVTVKRRPGTRVVFTIRATNTGNVADRFRFHGGGDHGPFHVRYLAGFTGTVGITRQVVNGTYLTRTVARGDNRVIRLVVDVGKTAKARSDWTWQIVVASANRSISRDVVGAHVFVLKGA